MPALFIGCNIAFFVSKDNIVRKEHGYVIIDFHNKNIAFISSKIDTSLSLSENLSKNKLGKAFYLYGLFPRQLNYLKNFGDSINGWVVTPVELKFIETKEVNHQLKKQKKKSHEHSIKVDNIIYNYQINIRNIHYISAFPLLSEEKQRQKTKGYEE